ncbi:DNA polymerase beta domain protein region [[Leptolyngbya] sp. PCC 7376]|uniref:nucleotidyltransferase family protein n=1 Tax=[Leptolyngbya] sp. PCC 7376 TaxID=111781 RepID=UPI00029EFACE|nr:nucleotidyltransferase domain-containing protein [[Leptolyngbya] sp. PCC 7376]AFY36695.1 DNA polymerase beta domain protein region [[Leptolyngbya] sp. PCC 7376]
MNQSTQTIEIKPKIYHRLQLTPEQLYEFCHRWQVAELSLFGSILRNDFNDESDIDFLVLFQSESNYGLFERFDMKEELAELIQRPVDLISKKGIENSRNWLRKKNILESAEVIYVA